MKDQLSALIDGELDIESADHVFTAAKTNGELKVSWQQYHLIGDAMRGDTEMSSNFCDKVMQSIDTEPTVLAVHRKNTVTPVVKKRTNGFTDAKLLDNHRAWSVAASVAAVMFVGLMDLQQQLGSSKDLFPVEIANTVPMEYLQAHQSSAPSGAAYYIQTVGFLESEK